jgi:hypothetical protein
MSDWNVLLFSATETHFEEKWHAFNEQYGDSTRKSLEYVNRVWIPQKEKFVSCWADKHVHIGSITTSRVEGNHSVPKNT